MSYKKYITKEDAANILSVIPDNTSMICAMSSISEKRMAFFTEEIRTWERLKEILPQVYDNVERNTGYLDNAQYYFDIMLQDIKDALSN